MSLIEITQQAGEWLRGSGPQSEIIISSRVRLARNLVNYPFANKATSKQRQEVLEICKKQITNSVLDGTMLWLDLNQSPPLDRQLLVERHLVSRQHASSNSNVPRGVAVDSKETFAVMVNEEDHLRMQSLRSGMQLGQAYQQIDSLDDLLEEKLEYAYSSKLGYLTACPTNVGTAMRVSVMMHLPALKIANEIAKVKQAAKDMHLAVRGLFGEGSKALGDLYQISNQTTLGKAEQEIVDDFENNIVPKIIAYEKQARQVLVEQKANELDDKIYRAWAILTSARMIESDEVFTLLSYLRLGINLGRINNVDIRAINELFLLTQPAHLQKLAGQLMTPEQRKIARATFIRERLINN